MKNENLKTHGIAVPIFALQGKYGIGDIASLRNLIQRLKGFPIDVIQVLPLNALGPFEISPYSSISAFANELLYIDIDLLSNSKTPVNTYSNDQTADYALARRIKTEALKNSYGEFINSENLIDRQSFAVFKEKQRYWLESYSHFHYRLDENRCAYWDWSQDSSKWSSTDEVGNVEFYSYVQWIFYEQWQTLRTEAGQVGITLMGDLPIYVSKNSADVWSNPELFQTGIHAGVPPDLYSEDGQDWGNPIYDWDLMQEDNFLWWRQRMEWLKEFFDIVRVDHIRGLHDYWAVKDGFSPKETKDWIEGPRDGIIEAIREAGVEIIGEDLGLITKEVEHWMRRLNVPGYRVFIFGWGWYAKQGQDYGALKYKNPNSYPEHSLCCSSTHDSESLTEFLNNLTEIQRSDLRSFLNCSEDKLRITILRSLRDSPSKYVIHPIQDLMDLSIRINTPGTVGEKNWTSIIPLDNLEQGLTEYFSE